MYFCSWDLVFSGAGFCWQISTPLHLYFCGMEWDVSIRQQVMLAVGQNLAAGGMYTAAAWGEV